MVDQYVPDEERDAILDRLLTLSENKVSKSFTSPFLGLFWLQKQEPQMGFFQYRHIHLLPLHC